MIVVVLWMGSMTPGNSPATSIVIVCVPGVSGCKSATHPSATEKYGRSPGSVQQLPGSAKKMLSGGRLSRCSGELTFVRATTFPSSLAVTVVIPAFTARAHARSSASLLPKKGGPSRVLHSADHAATKTFVPGFTVHVIDSLPAPNGATTPPRSTHSGPPPPNGFCGVGVSSTFFHIAPRESPSFLSGTAAAEGAATPRATT